MMNKIRDWGFPVGVLMAWLAVAIFTIGDLNDMSRDWAARRNAAPVSASAKPAASTRS